MYRTVERKVITEIAQKAGAITLAWYQKEVSVAYKADQSPVTAADLAAKSVYLSGSLARRTLIFRCYRKKIKQYLIASAEIG